ncbi:hypothetical protein PNP85_04155 [Halobacterium salinarum]|uniref:hypothetical protein n=1 Tax=Halobacterium salinarum TaxID=2242 RepID=UPI0025556041|nr:hypothetical protein [Halobacterium salinarum]MDL0135625.1 hypothetical protein [Halobacterium salinarum]MDL0138700.1 hypothetical protein [Halobacterium salinarum]
MSSKLGITDALTYGFDRLTTRGGLILVVGYALLQILTQVSIQSLMARAFAGALPSEQLARSYPLALDLPVSVTAILTVLMMIVGTTLTILAMRAMYEHMESFPTAEHTRRLPRTIIVALVVSVIVAVSIFVGSLFLLLPGIFLAVCLVFAQVAVVIEDAGVIESLKRSWGLTKGHRIRLFALGFIISIVAGFVGGFFGVLSLIVPVAGTFLSAILLSIVSLYSLGVLVGAYKQLTTNDENQSASSDVSL